MVAVTVATINTKSEDSSQNPVRVALIIYLLKVVSSLYIYISTLFLLSEDALGNPVSPITDVS